MEAAPAGPCESLVRDRYEPLAPLGRGDGKDLEQLIGRAKQLGGAEHVEVAARIREALRLLAGQGWGGSGEPSAEPNPLVRRARRLLRFFAQHLFVAEPYTHLPRSTVSRAESVRTCREILDGLYDDLPEDAFYFVGGIDEVRARAQRLSAGA